MKTLIITGTSKQSSNDMVYYDLSLFGQTNEHPLCVYITSLSIEVTGFSTMQDICRNKFAQYFNTDLFNIISLENITSLNAYSHQN